MTERTELRPVFSVTELNRYVSALLQGDPNLRELTVRGEISGFKRHTSGHLYFMLKDEAAAVKCVIFKGNAMKLRFRPEDGMQIRLTGYASLYGKDGSFQIYGQTAEKEGEGALYARFVALKAALEEKGYFDAARKRPIPAMPRCIGVVTSGSGAALQDILQITARRFPQMPVCLTPVKVQGEGAAAEIAEGIRLQNRAEKADVLIVGRGGGSMEDLWAFNEPEVAEAIFRSRIPVISAVGHETDFTIADFTADLRAPTPSAAAELAVPDFDKLAEQLLLTGKRLAGALETGTGRRRDKLRLLLSGRGMHSVQLRLSECRYALEALAEKAGTLPERRLLSERRILERLGERLKGTNPEAVLKRGYALVTDPGGRVLQSAGELVPGSEILVRMHDGGAAATVRERMDNGITAGNAGRGE